MNGRRTWTSAVLILGIVALSGCAPTRPRSTPIDEPSTQEGLQRVEVRGIDAVYRRPDADASKYDKILLRRIEVAFAKNWKPESGSVLYQMREPDREKIKQDLADAFADVFRQELETEGGYHIVTESGPDVLEVRAAIVNLYITAPDVTTQLPARSKVYTADAGHMTLIAELYDSVTGELLSRAFDHEDADSAIWQWTTSVSNTAEARRIIASWADKLRNALDASRGKTSAASPSAALHVAQG